jgi:hypothetical protein
MSSAATLRRTLLVALASLALCAPAAVARPADLPSQAPTSALTGTTDESASYVLRHQFDAFPTPTPGRDPGLAQERSYSTYGDPAPPRKAATTAATDTGDGNTWVPIALAVFGALIVALGAGIGLVHARRRATRLAT